QVGEILLHRHHRVGENGEVRSCRDFRDGIATNRRTRVKMRRHGRGHVAARRETHDADVVLGQMVSIGVVTYPTHRAPSVVDGLRIAMTRTMPVLQYKGGHVMSI